MKRTIQRQATELGFDACRFTSAAPPSTGPHFKQWLDAGCHGTMGYLQRNAHKRLDLQQVLASVRTVIVLAVTYGGRPGSAPTGLTSSGNRAGERSQVPPTGVVARYARFHDYHDVLADRLKTLAAFVDAAGGPGTHSLWYVDTGPILERDLGQRAALGFVGKHTNLISRQLGNWFFIAEILTSLEVEPDAPERNHCGSCTRCLTACPTQAIVAPFQLDARRCISYLTIELKGSIPVEFRRAIGRRIYGCDDCLEACPWNRFAREGQIMREVARPDLDQPELLALLSLDDFGFRQRFAGSPIMRGKRRGLLRNVCVALGNSGDPSALPALGVAASDPEPVIAEHATWAIQEIQRRHATR